MTDSFAVIIRSWWGRFNASSRRPRSSNCCAIHSAISGNTVSTGIEPSETENPLLLDALAFGNLVHATLQAAVTRLEASGRFCLGYLLTT